MADSSPSKSGTNSASTCSPMFICVPYVQILMPKGRGGVGEDGRDGVSICQARVGEDNAERGSSGERALQGPNEMGS